MKNFIIPFAAVALFFASCSSDDSSANPDENNTPTADFLPLQIDNHWIYNVESETAAGQDYLYISGTETINGKVYNKFLTQEAPIGFYSNSLYNSAVRQEGDKLLVTGQTQFSFAEGVPLDINVTDFVIFKENAANGQTLSTTSGTITQNIGGYDMQINYVLTTTAKGDLASHTAGTQTYNDIKKVETVLNLTISSPVVIGGVQSSVTVMPSQNVIVSTQYYAKEIGVVHVETDINYNLSPFAQTVPLPVPTSFNDHQEEILSSYNIN